MELKKLLSDLGYNDNQIEAITNRKKIYFQDDVDSIVTKKEYSLKEKFERNFVSKTDYDLLHSEHNTLLKNIKKEAIKKEFLNNGGNEKYFDDYMNLNQNLMDMEGKDINSHIKSSAQRNPWAFSEQPQNNTPYGYGDNDGQNTGDNNFDGQSIYGKKWD